MSRPDIKRVGLSWDTWNQYLRISTSVLPPVASVSCNVFDRSAIYASDLVHGIVNSMAIMLIPETKQASCYGPHPFVCLLHLGGAVLLASEALDQLQVFDFVDIRNF